MPSGKMILVPGEDTGVEILPLGKCGDVKEVANVGVFGKFDLLPEAPQGRKGFG